MKNGVGFRLRQAGKRFNRDWIFRQLDLELHAGHQLALTGPNGSGKSTLLAVISAYQSLSEGEISWQNGDKILEREKVYGQLMLSGPYLELPEHLTATELFSFHFDLKGCSYKGDYPELLENAGLLNVRHKLIRDYSSGMKQRLKLLLAFYSDVPLLLLDEPTANLDERGIKWYQQLKAEAGADKSLVIASNLPHEYEGCTHVLNLVHFK
jgi:ABC-type multidrug transport system ATPase subunit